MKTWKKILITLMAVGAIATTTKKANAGVDANLEYITSQNSDNNIVEVNSFYGLPGKINGFTFVDYNNKGDGYFGKTTLTRSINGTLSLRGQAIHATGFPNQYGIGEEVTNPKKPFGISSSIYFMPYWTDSNGKKVEKSVIGGCIDKNLPLGIKLKVFGEVDIADKAKWLYGETMLSKKIKGITVMYNPSFNGNGDMTPTVEHRISIGYDF